MSATDLNPEWVECAIKQDEKAVEKLMEWLTPRVHTYCYHFWQDIDRAQDSTQEILYRILRHLPHYRPRGPFMAWVYRIAFNYVRQKYRYEKIRRWFPLTPRHGETLTSGHDSEHRALLLERIQWLSQGLHRLNSKERTALILRGVAQLSYEEIAQVMNCSLPQVKNYLFRGRKTLQHLWSKHKESSVMMEERHA